MQNEWHNSEWHETEAKQAALSGRSIEVVKVAGAVSDVLKAWGVEKRVANHQMGAKIADSWATVAGQVIAEATDDLDWIEGVLLISASSATVRHEVSLRQVELASEMNRLLGGKFVKQIEVRPWRAKFGAKRKTGRK